MIEQILNAAFAPFLEQVGWQGFAYGLLGLKTIAKTLDMIRGGIERRANKRLNTQNKND